MKIIGYERADFRPKDGDVVITGVNVFVTRPADPNLGKGVIAERIYLTDKRMAACYFDITSAVGKEVNISYSRYGRVSSVTLA